MTQIVNARAGSSPIFLLLLLQTFLAGSFAQPSPAPSIPDTTTASDSVITFNEIMYHPPGDDPKMEWIELYNEMSVNMDISNWRIEGAVEFRFPTNTTFAANSYLVVAADVDWLKAATGATNVFGPFSKQLSNNGETLRLRNNSGRLMDEMHYSDQEPWPVTADGSGASLAKRSRYFASSPAGNWRASAQYGGTPGKVNFEESQPATPPTDNLIAAGAGSRWIIPVDDSLGSSWVGSGFADSGWNAGKNSLGYDTTAPDPSQVANVALGKTVIDGSGAYSNNPFNVPDAAGNFVAQNVVDGSTGDIFGVNYWLGREGVLNEYFTLDLGAALQVQEIRLRNTHNTQYNDRGTAKFQIYGALDVDGNKQLLQPLLILSGTLASSSGLDPIPAYSFKALNGLTVTNVRYLKFVALTANNAGNNVGLNEIEVYAPPPGAGGSYHGYFETDLQSAMFQQSSSVYVRLPFVVPSGVSYDSLTLRMHYADGFVAFLNGVEILRRNAPAALSWDSSATLNRLDADALQLESFDLTALAGKLLPGANVLAIQGLNSAKDDTAFLLSAELSGREASPSAPHQVAFNETGAANGEGFFVELLNFGKETENLANWRIISSAGGQFTFPATALSGGGFLSLGTNDLGFTVQSGDKLFLLANGQGMLDGVQLHNRARGRAMPTGPWLFPSSATPGQANVFTRHHEVVINEIMYNHAPRYRTETQPYTESPEQWVELYNRSQTAVEMSGWKLDGDVTFTFPTNTVLAADAYLVIAKDAPALRAQYPDITVLGDFKGKLPHNGGHIVLKDEFDNPANEVTFYNDHPWPGYANGGGSSLELRDPRADNSVPESWAASIESGKSSWRHYSYKAKAIAPVYSPGIFSFNEFRLGLLNDGEALVDNITVQELPDTGPRQLLQNTNFSTGTSKWRLLGNHSHSYVEPSTDDPSNNVLHLVSRGPTSYMDNRLETTLKVGTTYVPVVTGRDYQIDFDAKWVAGSPQVHTELYYNKVTRTVLIDMPEKFGTPGKRNSTFVANAGPVYSGVRHSPTIPSATQDVVVSIHAADVDGVAGLKLWYGIKGAWRQVDMAASAEDPSLYFGTIPHQVSGTVIQFYVEGTDLAGATSTYPGGGRASRALVKVDVAKSVTNKQVVRTIMTPEDSSLMHATTNLMSDDLLGCTLVHNEREVFYDAQIRLHGSMFSRTDPTTTGMTIKLPADHLFRGSRSSIICRRRGMVETLVKHILNAAGGIPGNYDDLIMFVSHRTDNVGNARLNLANYDATYVDSQFEGDNDGTVFKLEGIREFQTTNNGTPEGYKLPMPVGWIQQYDIANLGDDAEQYRWSILIQSQHERDDYTSIVRMGKSFSMTGAALQQNAGVAIDVDEWARLFALQWMLGIADVYTVENPHNLCFYARPSDGRVVALQNDWEFAFGAGTSSIYGNKNLFKVLQLPGYRRLYQGHLLDLINSVCNSAYLTPWARHYSTLTGEGYTGDPGYVGSRATFAKSKLLAKVPFEITSNSGVDYSVNTPTVSLTGTGWIDVRKIGRTGESNALQIAWTDDTHWQTAIPLKAGDNKIELTAYGFRGEQVGQDSITVTTTISEFPQRDYLRITELMYHPADPNAAELAAGFSNSDDFEFIELLNIGSVPVPLSGVRFTSGITFDFTGSPIVSLGPEQRVLLVKNREAFELRYGKNFSIAGVYTGSLNNAGELIRLVDTYGIVIQEFSYSDSGSWPLSADGQGNSLEALDPAGDYNNPLNWQASAAVGGTPGAPAVIAPRIVTFGYSPSLVQIGFGAAPGQSYSIYRRDDLGSGSWEKFGQVGPTDTFHIEQVTDIPNGQRRFYRIATP